LAVWMMVNSGDDLETLRLLLHPEAKKMTTIPVKKYVAAVK
jgi:hypothetical protein